MLPLMHRVLGCLQGIAAGDAVGKQTENLAHGDVRRWYPSGLDGFVGAPGTPIPRYRQHKRREWLIGETTDDTERTLAVARAIIRDGEVHHATVGAEMLSCHKSVHAGVRSLYEFHEASDPTRVASGHDGCGAAIRVAPVGLLYRPGRLSDIVASAREASISTHSGVRAIVAAAANAAAVSAAVEGDGPDRVVAVAKRAAAIAESAATGDVSGIFAKAFDNALVVVGRTVEPNVGAIAAACFPDHTFAIVSLALALAVTGSARRAILAATNVGGDSDSVASIAGGIAGAIDPTSVPSDWSAIVEEVNGLDLRSFAAAIAVLRL